MVKHLVIKKLVTVNHHLLSKFKKASKKMNNEDLKKKYQIVLRIAAELKFKLENQNELIEKRADELDARRFRCAIDTARKFKNSGGTEQARNTWLMNEILKNEERLKKLTAQNMV